MSAESEFLALSGVQHFLFCKRQWALIHIERVWEENILTTEGEIMHDRVHDESYKASKAGVVVERGLPLCSHSLKIYGVADIVEFSRSDQGCEIPGRRGNFEVFPVEYKRGKSKFNDCDRGQLCLQAMCLEEMLACKIPHGAVFYGQTRRREEVEFSTDLRAQVAQAVGEMQEMFAKGYVPPVLIETKPCKSCSLVEYCLPKMQKSLRVDFSKEVTLHLSDV